MIIDASNPKKEKNFFILLPFYRLSFLRLIELKMIGENKDIKLIIKALNIKDKHKRNEFIYLSACDQVDKMVEGKNLCDFQNKQCFVQRQKKSKRINGCCGACNCKYQHGKGCETVNIAGKLFFCKAIVEKHVVPTAKDLKILKAYNLRRQYISRTVYFKTTKDVLKYINKGSAFYLIMKDAFSDFNIFGNKNNNIIDNNDI